MFHIALQRYHGDCNKGESVPKTSNKDLEHNLTQNMIGILSALLPIYKYHI